MKSSTFPVSIARVSALVLFVLAGACKRDGEAPGTTAPAAGGSGSGAVKLSVTVNAPDATMRRNASASIEAQAPLPDGQLMFELPKDCQIVAGAAVRQIKNIGGGSPIKQELAFNCPAGTSGDLKATFKGTDASGKPLEQVATASLQ